MPSRAVYSHFLDSRFLLLTVNHQDFYFRPVYYCINTNLQRNFFIDPGQRRILDPNIKPEL